MARSTLARESAGDHLAVRSAFDLPAPAVPFVRKSGRSGTRSRVERAMQFARILIAVAAVVTAGCSNPPGSFSGVPGMPEGSSADCVDAHGPNSTPEQIIDAALAAPVPDVLTGEIRTVSEEVTKLSGGPPSTGQLLDTVYKDVPAGGDAAFAAAVCRLSAWAIPNGSFVYDVRAVPSDRKTVVELLHIIRGFGRQQCDIASTSQNWEGLIDEMERDLRQAKSDPEGHKKSLFADLDQQVALNTQLGGDPAVAAALAAKARESIDAIPADQLVAQQEAFLQVKLLAVQHQCPQFHVEDCGSLNPFSDGAITGTLKVVGGRISCDDAKRVIRYHYFPSEEDPNSGLPAYFCSEKDARFLLKCLGRGDVVDRPTIFVKPVP